MSIFLSLVIAACSCVLFLVTQFEQPRFQDASVDAKFFPSMVAIGQIILCVILLLQNKWQKRTSDGEADIFSKMSALGVMYIVSYVLLINLLGYLLATLAAFTVYLFALHIRKISYYLVAWSFVAVVYYLFGEVFYIALPEGLMY
ncbi:MULTISPECIES: tripartite tricarboxylate transporter TctB family protein [unclassified Vibrio]|uniref:Tripartite tricarboxylate transporter TctB family protein n=1 Tax=Vibrio sp. HB236076 TaxID=3232307 RepID=A0AB39HJ70_9VIBR|nr:tripartite tricarboxylate transporter TctB family protein [Vibrio sp. HB161653]MDP5254966.1 tripartite tricarboxylate transporter TctB family protein [Vibrio sp. HB161653]